MISHNIFLCFHHPFNIKYWGSDESNVKIRRHLKTMLALLFHFKCWSAVDCQKLLQMSCDTGRQMFPYNCMKRPRELDLPNFFFPNSNWSGNVASHSMSRFVREQIYHLSEGTQAHVGSLRFSCTNEHIAATARLAVYLKNNATSRRINFTSTNVCYYRIYYNGRLMVASSKQICTIALSNGFRSLQLNSYFSLLFHIILLLSISLLLLPMQFILLFMRRYKKNRWVYENLAVAAAALCTGCNRVTR